MSLNLFKYLTIWGQVPDVIGGSQKPPGNTLCEQTLYSILSPDQPILTQSLLKSDC